MSSVARVEPKARSGLADQLVNGGVIAGLLAVLVVSEPRADWTAAFAMLGSAAGWGVTLGAAVMILALGSLANVAEGRLRGAAGFALALACFAAGGVILAVTHDLFTRLGPAEIFVRGPELLEWSALGFGLVLTLAGLGMAVLLAPGVRKDEALDLSRHDLGLLRVAVPVMIGEGVLVSAVTVARMLEWSAPGAVHGVLLFVAGGAFLAALWFSAASFGKMDEHERVLTYRQVTATFVVFFFVLAGWALVEAAGLGPALDAFHAFLLLNAVYLGLNVPWTLWACRHDLELVRQATNE